eukprot:996957-Prorocentrum_minimum.AAC.3
MRVYDSTDGDVRSVDREAVLSELKNLCGDVLTITQLSTWFNNERHRRKGENDQERGGVSSGEG